MLVAPATGEGRFETTLVDSSHKAEGCDWSSEGSVQPVFAERLAFAADVAVDVLVLDVPVAAVAPAADVLVADVAVASAVAAAVAAAVAVVFAAAAAVADVVVVGVGLEAVDEAGLIVSIGAATADE